MAAAALLGALAGAPAQADEPDHERARAAAEAGQVLPLATLLQRLAPQWPGQVLEVELERHHGRWLYEIKLLQPDGRLRKLKVDARDATVLSTRTRPSNFSER